MPSLVVETERVDDIRPLIPLAHPQHPLVFLRRGQGIVGLGEALRLEFSGPSRMVDAAAAWKRVAETAHVTDPLSLPGTGLVALGTFAFSDSSSEKSVLVVPSVIVGSRNGTSWITRINSAVAAPSAIPVVPSAPVRLAPGTVSRSDFVEAVSKAVARIRSHELSKVVLARDIVGQRDAADDLRTVIGNLALGYPDCWTFAVDGLIGSSPETLVSVSGGTVTARVLAGSAARGTDEVSDQEAAADLATSTKDQDEHQFALQSVLAALRSHSPSVSATELPFTLRLPNLWHLASDVEGELTDGSSSLDLVAALHPTAAVAGAPTGPALALIDELEPFDRGRYAGPVGWVGADGDGEWAIALRCAQVDSGGGVTGWAGAGIVADSIAEKELAETRMKFRPIIEAFGHLPGP